MDRMSATDAGFYFAESPNTPLHVGSVSVFEGPAPSYGDLVRLLVGKLPQVPRYRQRVQPVPLHAGRPLWVDDEHFQILYHVRHTAVPRPGSAEQRRVPLDVAEVPDDDDDVGGVLPPPRPCGSTVPLVGREPLDVHRIGNGGPARKLRRNGG